MKKTYLVLMTLGLALFMSSLGWAAMDWQIVYQTDFATNQGWQTNNANNYYLVSGAPGGSSAYHQKEIDPVSCDPTSCDPDNHTGEYAYHLLPGLTAGLPWRLEYDILPVSVDWAADARLSFTDADMTIGNMCGISPTYLTLNYGHDDSGYRIGLEWADSEGNSGGVRLPYYTPGTWYENLLEWDPDKREFYVRIAVRGGPILVAKTVTSSDPDFVGNDWPSQFNNIDRLAMSTVGDSYAPGATGISYIDNIVVSQVPEPATLLLLGLGGLLLRRRRR